MGALSDLLLRSGQDCFKNFSEFGKYGELGDLIDLAAGL